MKSLMFLISLFFCLNLQAKTPTPSLQFTGYKYSEKAGVSGTFKKIDWKYNKKAKSIKKLLKEVELKIDSYSIDAGNSARNTNITQSLFRTWGGRYIKAKLKKADLKNQFVEMELKIGKKVRSVFLQYSKIADELVFSGSLDLLQLGFFDSFANLSKKCSSLHTGKDGVSKTWSTVDLMVKVPAANLK